MDPEGLFDLIALASLTGEPLKRFLVFDSDVADVRISYRDYVRARNEIMSTIQSGAGIPTTIEVIHYAKTFVVAVRRVARLAEDLVKHRSDYGAAPGDRIKIAWQKKRALLDSYKEPRNAIEHIDEELGASTSWILTSMENDTLIVTAHPDQRAGIAESTVTAIVALRAEMVAALSEQAGA